MTNCSLSTSTFPSTSSGDTPAHETLPNLTHMGSYHLVSLSDQVSNCLSDMSAWMQDHHLHLDLGKAKLVFLANRSITT